MDFEGTKRFPAAGFSPDCYSQGHLFFILIPDYLVSSKYSRTKGEYTKDLNEYRIVSKRETHDFERDKTSWNKRKGYKHRILLLLHLL